MLRPRPATHRRAHRAWAAAGVVVAFAAVAMFPGGPGGCTVTPENYKVLSFFFDGVPDPAMAGPGGNTAGMDPKLSPTYSVHKPYEEEKCDACHRVGLRPGRTDSSICLPCHEKVPVEHRYMHGPVAAGACMWCHAPHESIHRSLLRDADRKVCAQCHTAAMLAGTKVPEHADESRACLECHTGHGGPAPYMLRAAAEPKAPPPGTEQEK